MLTRQSLQTIYCLRLYSVNKLAQFRRTERVNVIQYIRLILCRAISTKSSICFIRGEYIKGHQMGKKTSAGHVARACSLNGSLKKVF